VPLGIPRGVELIRIVFVATKKQRFGFKIKEDLKILPFPHGYSFESAKFAALILQ
jgi:hypothetical protein